MDSALDEDKSELTVLVLSVFLQVFSHIDGLLDEVVKVFRELWGQSVLLQDSEDLIASDTFDLRNTIVISEDYTDLRWRATLLG
jgi:hypothetical protein